MRQYNYNAETYDHNQDTYPYKHSLQQGRNTEDMTFSEAVCAIILAAAGIGLIISTIYWLITLLHITTK